jgi:GAF domain-containing protein
LLLQDATRFLRAQEVEAIARLCDQIAGAVQHARLLEISRKARAESEQLRRQADALNALFADLARQKNMQEIMDRVMTHIRQAHGVEPYYSLYSVDSDQKKIRCWAIEFPPWGG